jgi:hypothetical protein
MKLTSAVVKQTEDQLEGQAVPENHPAVPQLSKLFGDHTFFVDGEGLSIVEPAEAASDGRTTGQVVKLANWNDQTRTSLTPHAPEPTDILVALDADGPETA